MNPPVATPFFFYLLAGTMIIGGILVITRKNAVHSAILPSGTRICAVANATPFEDRGSTGALHHDSPV